MDVMRMALIIMIMRSMNDKCRDKTRLRETELSFISFVFFGTMETGGIRKH